MLYLLFVFNPGFSEGFLRVCKTKYERHKAPSVQNLGSEDSAQQQDEQQQGGDQNFPENSESSSQLCSRWGTWNSFQRIHVIKYKLLSVFGISQVLYHRKLRQGASYHHSYLLLCRKSVRRNLLRINNVVDQHNLQIM